MKILQNVIENSTGKNYPKSSVIMTNIVLYKNYTLNGLSDVFINIGPDL